MYVNLNSKRLAVAPVRMVKRLPGGYRRLGDSTTCWIDAKTGAQVCGAGDPTGQTNCVVSNPYNQPPSSALAPDGTTWNWSRSGNTLIGDPKSHNKRTYTLKYHSGYSDVYQRSGGSGCQGFSCDFVIVDRYGNLTFASSAPTQSEIGCSNITTAVTTGSTTTTVSSQPVVTYQPQVTASSPYVSTEAATTQASGFSLSSIPTWAWIVGAGGVGVLATRMASRR